MTLLPSCKDLFSAHVYVLLPCHAHNETHIRRELVHAIYSQSGHFQLNTHGPGDVFMYGHSFWIHGNFKVSSCLYQQIDTYIIVNAK